ncbi:MAG TPA: hypothetical protein VKX17_24990 [Planctomycetota bacterium]|nr:hypothetical protein [Planctomycetota bacterium]
MPSETAAPRKRKRRWFQFHLSTALAVMLAAGGIMYLNTREVQTSAGLPTGALAPAWGWPEACYFRYTAARYDDAFYDSLLANTRKAGGTVTQGELEQMRAEIELLRFKIKLGENSDLLEIHGGHSSKSHACHDIILALILLAALGVFCEQAFAPSKR